MLFAYMNSKRTFWIFQIGVLVYFISLTGLVGTSRFSPDSWSYFELSKSIFSDKFYAFNTYRSYFSLERSTSFPFGFPVLLALINSQFGWAPENAAFVNGLFAALAFFLIYHISRKFQLEHVPAISLGVAFVFWPGFLAEVVSGRAYPAALFVLLLGLFFMIKTGRLWALFVGALLVGVSTNIRFDFLFGAWASMVLVLIYFNPAMRAFVISQIGFALGSLPWAVYSLYYFHAPWVSDNSWVSLAAHSAFVTDFPAASVGTIFTEPVDWLVRVIKNALRLIPALFVYLKDFPLLLGLLASGMLFLPFKYGREKSFLGLLVLSVLSLGLVPYALTGYFDQRYFSLFFLSASLSGLVLLSVRGVSELLYPFLAVLTLLVGFSALMYWGGVVRNLDSAREDGETQVRLIGSIASCQDEEPDITYFFEENTRNAFVFRYGAMTGHRVAARPRNLDWSDSDAVGDFLKFLGPSREISLFEFSSCDEFFSKNKIND